MASDSSVPKWVSFPRRRRDASSDRNECSISLHASVPSSHSLPCRMQFQQAAPSQTRRTGKLTKNLRLHHEESCFAISFMGRKLHGPRGRVVAIRNENVSVTPAPILGQCQVTIPEVFLFCKVSLLAWNEQIHAINHTVNCSSSGNAQFR
jgi:hypothetical protein